MSFPVSVGGVAGAVGTSPMAWTVLCTVAGAGAAAGSGVVIDAEIDLEGALSLAYFLTSYSAAFCASVILAYS
jgi:hypothetical protein